jgi:hypothetical protein
MNIIFEGNLRQEITADLDQLRASENSKSCIATLTATLHHETGERAYILGYHPLAESPDFTLVDIGGMTIGLFMSVEEMAKFEKSILFLRDGYIIIKMNEVL